MSVLEDESCINQQESAGVSRYANNFSKSFVDLLINACLDLHTSDDSDAIDWILTAPHDNLSSSFHTHFVSLQAFGKKGASIQSVLLNWFSQNAVENLYHTLITSPAHSQLIQTVSKVICIGGMLRAYTYEVKKFAIVNRVARWLALAGLVSLYTWVTAPSACPLLAKGISQMVIQCLNSSTLNGTAQCTCDQDSPYIQFSHLAHHTVHYLQTSPSDWQKHTVPKEIVLNTLQSLHADPNSILTAIWTDPRAGRSRSPPAFSVRKLKEVERDLTQLIQLQLEQILIYPHVKNLFILFGADLKGSTAESTVESTAHLRNHFVAVGGICAYLEKAFGHSVIFSYLCNDGWQDLIKNPARFFFNEMNCGSTRSTDRLGGAIIKDSNSVFKLMIEYIVGKLQTPIHAQELLITSVGISLIFWAVKHLGGEHTLQVPITSRPCSHF
jgi:hypothetical protein